VDSIYYLFHITTIKGDKVDNLKDKLTNILAVVLVVAGAINTYLQSLEGDINWMQLIMIIAGAVVAYFTGKTADGKTKSPVLIEKQKELR